jgi:cell division protein FtsQ
MIKRKRKKTFRFRFFLLLFFSGLAAITLYYLLSLPVWKIQEVVVHGAVMLSAEEIKDLSGVPVSENLFLSNFSRVRENLRKVTAIKDFHVWRIPPATVLIRITERKPIAVVMIKNKSTIIDEEGYILNRNAGLTLNIAHLTELPVISGTQQLLGTSFEVETENRIAPAVARLITEIIFELSSLLGSRNLQIETQDFEKISFLLDDILRVKIGRDENVKRKMEVFKKLFSLIADKWMRVEYVDVRFPDNPVIKFKPGA